MRNLAIVVQCRLSSTRLPDKALMDISGKTLLERTLLAMKSVEADYYYVACDEDSYQALSPIVKKSGWQIFAGPLLDVSERFALLAAKLDASYIMRATADNPFLFVEEARRLTAECETSDADYITVRDLPHGSGVEVFRRTSLLEARKGALSDYEREHVCPVFYNHPEKWKCVFLEAKYPAPSIRTTVDTARDLHAAILAASALGKKEREPFSARNIIDYFSSPHPLILLCPSLKKGHGSGHLQRMLKLSREGNFFIYIRKDKTLDEADKIVEEAVASGLPSSLVLESDEGEWDAIVADSFQSEKADVEKWRKRGVLLGIDEGGEESEDFDYLVDIIPSLGYGRKANLVDSTFISLSESPKKKMAKSAEELKKVLICVGGEDPARLAEKAALYFAPFADKVTAVSPAFRKEKTQGNITRFSRIKNLASRIGEWDLVVTHYGLTAFEAVSAGCAVILLATSEIHEKLSKKYGFICLSAKDLESAKKPSFPISSYYPALSSFAIDEKRKALHSFISKFTFSKRFFCPVCEAEADEADAVIFRTEEKTYRRCKKCGMLYLSFRLDGKGKEYTQSYFASEYKNQYGKTYLEDFEAIKAQSRRRARIIKSLLPFASSSDILDIGCAYGPFLAVAKEEGFTPYGTDISECAVEYVKKTLGFAAISGAFPDVDFKELGREKFDVVSMWFVIEHFTSLARVIKKANEILKRGGILAFSTPSAEGVSRLFCAQKFFSESPSDHYTLFEPSRVKQILEPFGFQVEKFAFPVHHPERFPFREKKSAAFLNAYKALSITLSLSDTFEVYCRKL